MNVLIYSDEGTSVESTKQIKECLRFLLSPHYAVSEVSAKQIINEPWEPFTALLVIPGGADLPYCKALNGAGNAKIKAFVRSGGRFLGLCAGAYFASSFCEFEPGTELEVTGPRELAFFKGAARGTVYKGFQYGTNSGTHIPILETPLGSFKCYFNGGCLFTEVDKNTEILATYETPVECKADSEHPPAVIHTKFGRGHCVLSGVHTEYSVETLHADDLKLEIIEELKKENEIRLRFMTLMLQKLELNITLDSIAAVPRITPLLLTSADENKTPSSETLLTALKDIVQDSGILSDANDTFKFYNRDGFIGDDGSEVKSVVVFPPGTFPSHRETPYFDHALYYQALAEEESKRHCPGALGRTMLYAEVVTSTSTMIDRNPKLLARLPHGTIVLGTVQTAGRGRGNNTWVNPPGCIAVSGVMRVPSNEVRQPMVFFQYMVSLAVVEAINSFGKDYEALDVRLKWPNDIYIAKDGSYTKIGGVLASCSVMNGDFILAFGSGTNVDNPSPTTSVNSSIDAYNARTGKNVPHMPHEDFLARMLSRLNEMFVIFLAQGFAPIENRYYNAWLHSNKVVTLENYNNVKVKILGLTHKYGMLNAQELDSNGYPTGQFYELQPDGNSFDMLRGLIRNKT
ncbi:Biotin--protein ligase [Wickerhamiella sorbophila]|uniref:Biotin--protein ligase n=1 Tax=Wickerhamiella sorbophila TaxID=45607 RepID=A0A2T0FPN6_9ASCO|nr:Biotin--protein ligase [Wickerhamiella sorbophila]PRT56966.1 Biotin--protein ligase [Wickerhamiella sorbophila]